MRNINQIEWRELLANDQSATIIDVRTPEEWSQGVLENAILLDVLQLAPFEEKAKKLSKEMNYYIYCRSGMRSTKACEILENIGIKNTFNLLGGILDWNGNKIVPVS